MKRVIPALTLAALLLTGCTIGGTPASTPASSTSPSSETSTSPTASSDESGEASPTPSATDGASGYPSDSGSPSASGSMQPTDSVSPSASTSGSAGEFRSPGEVLDLSGEVTITVLDSKRAKVSGHRNSQVLVMAKTCNTNAQAGIELTWDTWVLLGPDSEEYPASTVKGTNEPAPVYPNGNGRLYKPGQCAKGWIVFDVPNGSQLSGVRYMNSTGDSAQWRLSGNI
ncbi:hypothetical protein [Micropruina sonneratiae]|uniref:hypothetical protein n=1 Tax=Micropruina sonneratiae TaxID=2986940 RepID=UPI002227603B|nr:hypothetical protein [Micropruina sp. KQZ13P-5]MCW3157638.1 hypothetical protein [Micropruina sp. KQZ13P-5]